MVIFAGCGMNPSLGFEEVAEPLCILSASKSTKARVQLRIASVHGPQTFPQCNGTWPPQTSTQKREKTIIMAAYQIPVPEQMGMKGWWLATGHFLDRHGKTMTF